MIDRLYAVSPLDGRYADRTEPLVPYASEAALMRERVHIEVEYVIALADLEAIPLALEEPVRDELRSIYREFDRDDAARIKRIETEGTDDYPATNHDVKAIEYFLRERTPREAHISNWLHFGLTSEDVNNLAYRVLIRDAVEAVLRPAIETIRGSLAAMADEHRHLPMLSRTHGQPATPTTFGKELAVYADRLRRGIRRLDTAVDGLGGKLAGATGTYAAQELAYPEIDWRSFSETFVTDLGFEHLPLVTQVNPGDDLAALFDALAGINSILLDFDRDAWRYVSDGYLGQVPTTGETGSSTMPHKVNPIDFENSEGNLQKANADLRFLADNLPTSRLQRDLSSSTIKRTMGGSLAHCLIGYSKLSDGLASVVPDEEAMRADLSAHPEVLAEAIQTILRREGTTDAYERVKHVTRGAATTEDELKAFIRELDLPAELESVLLDLEPADYTGLAAELVDAVGG